MNSLRFAFLSAVLLPGWIGVAHAEITPEQRKYFETKIRPVLAKECYECHSAGAKKVGGKLLLDTTAGLKRGGESGSPMVPGKPEDSLLVHALKWLDDLEMPPENPLPANVIADFEKWIAMGAPVPPDVEQAVVKGGVTEPKKYKPGEL